jgi:hypothetical protein
LAVDRDGGNGDRQFGGEDGAAADMVGLFGELADAAHDYVINGGRIDAG